MESQTNILVLFNHLKNNVEQPSTLFLDFEEAEKENFVFYYKGASFVANYTEENFLIISGYEDGKEILTELKPILSQIMGYPAIEYDVFPKGNLYELPHLEFFGDKTIERIREIVSRENLFEEFDYKNIQLTLSDDITIKLENKNIKRVRTK